MKKVILVKQLRETIAPARVLITGIRSVRIGKIALDTSNLVLFLVKGFTSSFTIGTGVLQGRI